MQRLRQRHTLHKISACRKLIKGKAMSAISNNLRYVAWSSKSSSPSSAVKDVRVGGCMCVYMLVFSDKEGERHLTCHDLCSVGGIKLFVKRNTLVSCFMCVCQISPGLTHTQGSCLSHSLKWTLCGSTKEPKLIVTCEAHSIIHTHRLSLVPACLFYLKCFKDYKKTINIIKG